jgi:hypothetical protein
MANEKPTIRPEEALEKMIASLKEKTGRDLSGWQAVVAERGWQKHGEIVKGIKDEFGVSHGYANQIALRSSGTAKSSSGDAIADMFAKREEIKPIYDAVLAVLQAFGSDVDLAPKKGYVSVRRSKQFAILQPASGRLDVGIQLKGLPPGTRLEASGSFNAMLTHRVRVDSLEAVDSELAEWLRHAYNLA